MRKDIHVIGESAETAHNIAFAINERFVEPFAVAFRSLAETYQSLRLHVFIIFDSLPDPKFEKLEKLVSSYGISTTFLKVKGDQFSGLKTGLHFDKANYYRLYIPDLIPADKVLYLDSDILVKGDLSEIFNLDLGANYIAAVPELTMGWHPGLPLINKNSYFNSGVMLINSVLWREHALASKVIEFAELNPELVRFADQCGLNVCIEDKWERMPLKYNCQSMVFEEEFKMPDIFSAQEIKTAHDKPIIVHFTGSNKPWHMGNKHPYRWQYWQNLYHTPFKRIIPEDISLLNLIKFLAPKKLKMKLRTLKLVLKQKIKFR